MSMKKAFNTHGSVMGVITSSIFGGRKSSGSGMSMFSSMKHGSRHRHEQMKAMGRGRFTGRSSRFGL